MSFDLIGSIAILKFKNENRKEKLKIAKDLLKNKNIKTVLEKKERIKGRLRTIKTTYLAGVKTRETLHKENGCHFLLDIEKCYFSPRLSNERLLISKEIRKKDKILVMFSGIGVYPIVIAKNIHPLQVDAIELGRIPHKYALANNKKNKTSVNFYQGDVKRIVPTLKGQIYDKILMTRPQLKTAFVKEALLVSRKGTKIYYYDFGKTDELPSIIKKVEADAEKARKKILITNIKKAGDIAPYKFRWRIDFEVK